MAFDLISMDTLDLLEETESYWIFRFVPTAGDDDDQDPEKFMQKVTGTLKIIRAGNYPEYIRLQNDKPIRPAFGVKIKEFLNIAQVWPSDGRRTDCSVCVTYLFTDLAPRMTPAGFPNRHRQCTS
jgi:hypothetical protein